MAINLELEGALIAIVQNTNKSIKDKDYILQVMNLMLKMNFKTMNVLKMKHCN
jgi:hypothetical protein